MYGLNYLRGVAQLVARTAGGREVAGSSPVAPTTTLVCYYYHMSKSHYKKRIGILGGMSYESTIDLYEKLIQKHLDRYHDDFYPEITIQSVNFGNVYTLQDVEVMDKKSYIAELTRGLNALQASGVDFIVIAANTPHIVFNELQNEVGVPLRSIVRATLQEAKKKELSKVLLLGTKRTMVSDFYQRIFQQENILVVTPESEDIEAIDKMIFSELVKGSANQKAKTNLLDIINKYDVDGVILGCTELPMVISQDDLSITVLDTVEIQAEDTLSFAIY